MQRRWAAVAISLSLVLMGCSATAPQAPEPVQAPVLEAQPKDRTGEEWEAEGKRLVSEAKWVEAAHAYEEAAKQRPLADLWNEASYAYLMAQQYEDAIRAGEWAIKLDPSHAYALYNTGMAHLESEQPCEAIRSLEGSRWRQKERWEIDLALGRAYVQTDEPKRAFSYLRDAARLGAPADEVAKWQAGVDRLLTPPTLAVLTQAGKLLIQDGDLGFYRWTRGGQCNRLPDEGVWLVQNGQVELLLAGSAEAKGVKAVTLSNGQHAYWVQGEFVGAGISRTEAHYLVVLADGKLKPFQFTSTLYHGAGIPEVADFVPSWTFPAVEGDEMRTAETDHVAGLYSHHITWKLDPVQRTASQLKTYEEARIEVKALTATGLMGYFVSGYEGRDFPFTFAPNLQVTRAGKPATLADVKMGELVRVRMNDWQIFAIELANG